MNCFLPLLTVFFLCGQYYSQAQNLLSDGGFEAFINNNCFDPDKGFENNDSWYPIEASPDLFRNGCEYDETEVYFWDSSLEAYDGEGFAGLSSRWNSNGTYVSEGIATKLREPLIAGQVYFIEMAIRNRGFFEGLSGDFSNCDLNPDKHIDIYTSTDSITVTNDFATGTAAASGKLVADISSLALQSNQASDWTIVSGCFIADGGEQYLAIIMPLGTFGELPPCTQNINSGVFHSFYYHLDQVSLTPLQQIFEEEIQFCEGEPIVVDLEEIVNPFLLENSAIIWEGGYEGMTRTLTEPGRYSIEMISECGIIPYFLDVKTENCEPKIYIPNAFSPNGDGSNDELSAFFERERSSVSNFLFTIFDRWGNQVFESRDPLLSWNGKVNGHSLAEGIYLWTISYETTKLGVRTTLSKTGTVLLIK